MKTLTLLLASAACCLPAAPAIAAKDTAPVTVTGIHADDPDTIRISYRDLDLTNGTDAVVLRARVKRATLRTCDRLYRDSMLQMFWACRDTAWNAAAPQIRAAIERAKAGQQMATGLVLAVPRPAR